MFHVVRFVDELTLASENKGKIKVVPVEGLEPTLS